VPNVMGVLRAEIRRLARKETKDAVRDLKRQVAALRRRMAMTKKQMIAVERAAMRAGSARAAAPAAATSDEGDGTQICFSPRWVKVHRSRLGMSRRVYAKLVGVSPQTILLWESGKARPRRSALASWRAIRGKGIRELKAAAGGETRGRRGRPAAAENEAPATGRKPRGRKARGGGRRKARTAGRTAGVTRKAARTPRRARAKKK
jgi:DNA-binding transcriptional regulator YiaG